MTDKKRKSARRNTPSRIKVLAWILIAFLVLGIAGVKFLQSPRGSVFLLGKGFTSHYARAQECIQTHLLNALEEIGLAHRVKSKRTMIVAGGKRLSLLEMSVTCPDPCDFIRINLALTRAAHRSGAVVIRSREEAEGNRLLLEIGSGKFVTQRIIIHKGERAVPEESKLPTPPPKPQLALVVDDFGYAKDGTADAFLSLDLPLTISIIPSLPYSHYILTRALQAGKEVMLHLPMEPEQEYNSDVPMVATSMSDGDIERLVEDYLQDLGGVVGVNNHMGSKATQDERVMQAVLSVLKKRGLYFLDSLTSPRSVAYNVAKRLDVGTARNDLFLDADTQDPAVVERRLMRLVRLAKSRGHAVGIMHPRSWTLEVFQGKEEDFKNWGVRLVFLSEIVE
jgi:polysaccharide deacetylase 2 family uncharacterized protein YibQ